MQYPYALRALCLCLILNTRGLEASAVHSTRTDTETLIDQVQNGLQYQTQILEPTFDVTLNSHRVRVSYPLMTVPPMIVNGGMAQFIEFPTYFPCHDCLILSMEADVTYQDGTRATPANSFWLHHAVFVNRGKHDHFCGSNSWGQRFFAVGNERTKIDMSVSSPYVGGYYIGALDEVAVSVDLMNMNMEQKQDVIFTVTYEFTEDIPDQFISVQPVWLDIGGCESSSLPARADSVFEFTSSIWSSTLSGKVASVGAHLHDGGTHLQVLKNNQVVCEARPTYTTYSPYLNGHTEEHISTIPTCSGVGIVTLNDEWKVKAFYNTSLHKPMVNMDGSLEPIMGISLLYIAVNPEKDTSHKHGWLEWLKQQNFVLSAFCLVFGSVLALVWWWQNRSNQPVQLSHEAAGRDWHDLKFPLLSHSSD